MKKITRFLILLLSVSLLLSCSKSSTESEEKKTDTGGSGVPATETGAGTMGAVVGGNAWVAGVPGAIGIAASGRVLVQGTKTTTDLAAGKIYSETIQVNIGATTTGTFPITISGGSGVYNFALYIKTTTVIIGSQTTTETYTSVLNAGSVVITKYDTGGKILSGTFNFNASTADNSKSVAVTAGVFDIKY